jgi:hypothetical protein
MLDALTLALGLGGAVGCWAAACRWRRKPFPAAVPLVAALAFVCLLTFRALPGAGTIAHIPEEQPVVKAKPKVVVAVARVRPPQKYADRGRQREYERLWYSVAEEIGPPADVKCVPVPASVALGVRTPPAWR